ncbi:MAG TPA: GTPase, partial [Alkalispirochaeta sp.]|nr:GTPase [Alkalispirochaeta sp.]
MIRICIAGRPNVGKSTLFNRIYGRRLAITDSMPGVTRDAVAMEAEIGDLPVLLVDTGGIGEGEAQLDTQVYDRSRSEMARADVVLLLVDVGGLTGEDEELLELLRRSGTPSILVVNKVDNPHRDQMVSEFWQYGIPRVVGVSAAHGLGMDDLEDEILGILSEARGDIAPNAGAEPPDEAVLSEGEDQPVDPLATPVRLAIIGQPNTGKSSLLNRLIG